MTAQLTHRFSPQSSHSRSPQRELSSFPIDTLIHVTVADANDELFFLHEQSIGKIAVVYQKIMSFLPSIGSTSLKDKFLNFRPLFLTRFPLAFSLITIPQRPLASIDAQKELFDTKKYYQMTGLGFMVGYIASFFLFSLDPTHKELLIKASLACLATSCLLNLSAKFCSLDFKKTAIDFSNLALQTRNLKEVYHRYHLLVCLISLAGFIFFASEIPKKTDAYLDLPFIPSLFLTLCILSLKRQILSNFLSDITTLFNGVACHQKLLMASQKSTYAIKGEIESEMGLFLQMITQISKRVSSELQGQIERIEKVRSDNHSTICRLKLEILGAKACMQRFQEALESSLAPAIEKYEKKYLLGKISVLTTGLFYDPSILAMCPGSVEILELIKQKKREIAYLDASLNFHEHKEFEKIQPLFSRIIHISDQAFATQIFTQTCLVPKLEEKAIRFIIKKHETFCFEIHKLLFQMITPWILNALIVSSLFDKLIVDSSFIFEEPTRFYTVLTLQVFSWASFIWTLFQFIKLYNKPLCTSKKTVTPTFCYSSKLLEPLKIEMEQALQSRLSSFYEALRLPLDKTPLEPRSRSASPLFDLYLDELPDPEALSIEDLEHELHKKAQSLAQKLERSFYANLS